MTFMTFKDLKNYYLTKYFVRDIFLDSYWWVRSLFCKHDWCHFSTKELLPLHDDETWYEWDGCLKCGKQINEIEHDKN